MLSTLTNRADARVILVAARPGRSGGPAAWVSGLAGALRTAGLNVRLTRASDPASLRLVAELAGPDTILHTYSQSPGSLWLARTAKRLGSPVVHTVHGDFFAEQASKRGVKRLLWLPFNRKALAMADVITAPSEYLASSLAACEPASQARLEVIPNGIDVEALASAEPLDRQADLDVKDGAALVAAVTTFTHRPKAEGVIPVCRAVARLRSGGRAVELRVAGGGPLLADIRRRCEQDGIRFLGRVPEGPRLIAAADVFVHSSGLDVFACVVLEALATGVPVIVTPTGGVTELIGDAALKVPLGDEAALAERIATLLDDPAAHADLVARGKRRARAFDWGELVRERWLPLYAQLLRGKADGAE